MAVNKAPHWSISMSLANVFLVFNSANKVSCINLWKTGINLQFIENFCKKRFTIGSYFGRILPAVRYAGEASDKGVFLCIKPRRGGRVAEGAPLLREYGSKAHRGFESLPLRHYFFVFSEWQIRKVKVIGKYTHKVAVFVIITWRRWSIWA